MADKQPTDTVFVQLWDGLKPIADWSLGIVKNPTVRSLLVLATILGGSGLAGYYVGYRQATNSELEIAVVHRVIINNTYVKRDPSVLPIFAPDLYFVQTSSEIGPDEPFKNVDQGTKNNSADIQSVLQSYAKNSNASTAGHMVTLVVTGKRDAGASKYRNIILVEPEL
jgi:hypothetical protein